MFCKQCGRHIPEGETVCPDCGYNTATGTFSEIKKDNPVTEPVAEEPKLNEVPVTENIPVEVPVAEEPKLNEVPVTENIPVDFPVSEEPKLNAEPAVTPIAEEPKLNAEPTVAPVTEEPKLNAEPTVAPVTEEPKLNEVPVFAVPPAPQPAYTAPQPAPKKVRGGGFSIAGLVIAILNIIFFWFPFLPVLNGILGIIFSSLGIKSTQKTMGIVSLIINIVFLIVALLMSILWVYVIIQVIQNPNFLNYYQNYIH